ncbi:MAG: xylulokinase [Planctomycetes bacterium]|nr:xylulokinase [Planctomycetota bacterium]
MRGLLFIGIDVGTQSTKAVLLDSDSTGSGNADPVVARAARSYGFIEGLPPGAMEQHPHTWWEATCAVVKELLASPAAVGRALGGIAVSGQQHGLVVLDANGVVLRPAKLWCDTSTSTQAAELSRTLGHSIPTGFTASKLLWMAQHEPALHARIATVLLPHDWINFCLSGTPWMECGDASGTGFFDTRNRCFDARAVAALGSGLKACLPVLKAAHEFAGRVSAKAAHETGLPEGLPIAVGGGDNMMSALGAGAGDDGIVVLSLGTSATVFARSAEPVIDSTGAIAPFCDSTGAWLPLLCVMNATGVLEELRLGFGGMSMDAITEEAARVAPGCEGVSCIPFFGGERVPDLPHATGSFRGLRSGSFRAGILFRAALEGITANLALGVQRLRALGVEVRSVRCVGGGARNALWRSMLADALDVTVECPMELESAALGAALQSAWVAKRAAGSTQEAGEFARPFVRLAAQREMPSAAGRAFWAAALPRYAELFERY